MAEQWLYWEDERQPRNSATRFHAFYYPDGNDLSQGIKEAVATSREMVRIAARETSDYRLPPRARRFADSRRP